MRKILLLLSSFFVFVFLFISPLLSNVSAVNCSTKPTWSNVGHVDSTSSITWTLTLKESCFGSSSYTLTASRPSSGWSYQYSGCSVNTPCTKTFDGSITVKLTITRPTGASGGNYTITASADNSSISPATIGLVYTVCSTCSDKSYQCGSFTNNCGAALKCGNNGACVNSTYTCTNHICISPTPTPTNVPTATPRPTNPPTSTPTPFPTPTPLPPPPPPPSCDSYALDALAPGSIPTGGMCMVERIIRTLIDILLIFTVIAAIVFFIWGGISWITSEGNKQKVAGARTKVTFAVAGLILALLSFAIIHFIYQLLRLPFP